MNKHCKKEKHPIYLRFSDMKFYCVKCQNYVYDDKFKKIRKHFQIQKQQEKSSSSSSESSKDAEIDFEILRIQPNEESKSLLLNLNKEHNFDMEEDKIEDNKFPFEIEEDVKQISIDEDVRQIPIQENARKISIEEIKIDMKQIVPPEKSLTRIEFVQRLKEGYYKTINVIAGEGINTSTGIPDFRSSKNDLFQYFRDNYGIDEPYELFLLKKFIEKPKILYDYLRDYNWEIYDPSLTHYFIAFLSHKGLINKFITLNIDRIESKTGMPENQIVRAYGHVSEFECPKPTCKKHYTKSYVREKLAQESIFYCEDCRKRGIRYPVKPKVVFHGEGFPVEFYFSLQNLSRDDCWIILGTALSEPPFNRIPAIFEKSKKPQENDSDSLMLPKDKPDLVTINKEPLDYHVESSLFVQGDWDEAVQQLIDDLEWTEEFDQYVTEAKAKSNINSNQS